MADAVNITLPIPNLRSPAKRTMLVEICFMSLVASRFIAAAPLPPRNDIVTLNSSIIMTAGGGPPTGFPAKLTTTQAVASVQLLQYLEQLEVALYYEGYKNITSGQWDLSGTPKDTAEIILKTAAQEDVHTATLEGLLQSYNASVIPPCKYSFPASNVQEFFAIANLITPANYGSIIGVQNLIGATTPSIVPSSTAILATEVRHEVFLRFTANEIPNPAPFETGIPPEWGYNVARAYVVAGSCPVDPFFTIYPPLYFEGRPAPAFAPAQKPTTLNLEWDANQTWEQYQGDKDLYITWVDLANAPFQTSLNRTGPGKGTTTVPDGLQSVAYIAITQDKVNNLIDLPAVTLAGPLAVPIS